MRQPTTVDAALGVSAWSLLLLLMGTPVSAQTAPPAGTWAELPNTQLWPAIPSEAKVTTAPGGTPELWSPYDLFAYSGADVAQIKNAWGFLYWGGGHAATPDNSLYWVPFDGSGPRRLSGPYLAPDRVYKYDDPLETYRSVSRNAPSTVTLAAAPKSRHTYSSLVAIEIGGRSFLFSFGGSLYVGSGSGTGVTRLFDLSQTYEQAMARPDMGWVLSAPAPGGAVSSSSGWDPVRKRVIVRSKSFIGAYYPVENRWENWNIGNAPYGSDFESSVAMDVAGRKMYVIGNRLVEAIDLDTKTWTDLRTKPWAAKFATPVWQGGYQNGPGISWHSRTKQIVAWVGGNNLLLINPATDAVKHVVMTGTSITVPRPSGASTFGRFRGIPGTDQVVLVNSVDQNVFIGTVPFDGGMPIRNPTPSPVPTPTSPPSPSPAVPKSRLDRAPSDVRSASSTTPVASVVVGPSADNLLVGDSQRLMAVPKDEKGRPLAGRHISWSSSQPETATVSPTGVVSGHAPGTAQIISTSEGKSGTGLITVWANRTDTAECEAPKPGWIWCDDFEKDRLSSYFAYNANGADFVRLPGVGYGGSAAMRARFSRAGQVQGGFLHLAMGKTPWSYLRPVDAGTTVYREIYWRHFVKLEIDWIGAGGNKLSRAQSIVNRDWSQAMMAHVWSGVVSDGEPYRLGIAPASGTDEAGRVRTTSYNDFAHFRWLGVAWSRTPIFDEMRVGKWYCVEAHARLNDPGRSNGVFELWINNGLEARMEGLNWQGAYSEYGINTVFLENYWNDGAPKPQERYFDNFVVSTEPIGC